LVNVNLGVKFAVFPVDSITSMSHPTVISSDFTPIAVQVVAFLGDQTYQSGRLIASLLVKFGDKFDADPQALPVPLEMARDIPRIVLQSTNEVYRFEGALDRFASHWIRHNETRTDLVAIVNEAAIVVGHCLESLDIEARRLGLLVKRAFKIQDPQSELIRLFCSKETQTQPFDRSSSFEIHNHKSYNLASLSRKVNSWVRCKSGVWGPDLEPAIIVEHDINTLFEEMATNSFGPESTQRACELFVDESESIIRKYFPGPTT
jgi:hypothetical protein